MAIAIVVDWCGPFSSVEAAQNGLRNYGVKEGLYLALGKRAYQRETSLQYVGISNDTQSRLYGNHHGLSPIVQDFSLWIGSVVSHAMAGRRNTLQPMAHSVTVDRAEWAMAYFLSLPLNIRKRSKPPPESLILVNRWFRPDFETRRSHRGHKSWPDLIDYDKNEGGASVVWFGSPGRRERLSPTAVKGLRRRSPAA